MKFCISCGMPINEEADFARDGISKDYCASCAHEDGSMPSFEKTGMINFIIKTEGFDTNPRRLDKTGCAVRATS